MQNTSVFIFLLLLVFIQAIFSFAVLNDEPDDIKLVDERQISSSSYYSPLPSSFLSNGKQGNDPECLSKNLLVNMLSRNRRASISRPYFHHWRGSRDNTRYTSKNLLPFSPRLGKRADEDEDIYMAKHQSDEEINSPDLDAFLSILIGHLQRKKIDIVYEDSTKICLSEAVSDALIKEVLEKIDSNRRQQEEQEARERQTKSKHPLLFRYRLG